MLQFIAAKWKILMILPKQAKLITTQDSLILKRALVGHRLHE